MKKITPNSSKQEEIDCLKSIQNSIPEGTYLHDLFTNELFSWVENQIKIDFPPNIMWEIERAYREVSVKVTERQKTEKELSDYISKYKNLLYKVIRKLKKKNDTIKNLKSNLNHWKKSYEDERKCNWELHRKNCELKQQISDETFPERMLKNKLIESYT